MTGDLPILSHFQAACLEKARTAGLSTVVSSADLALSSCSVQITAAGALFADTPVISWEWIAEIAAEKRVCFRLTPNGPSPVRIFAEESGRLYSLMPTEKSPALLLSGVTMHRFRDTHPQHASALMVRALGHIKGPILDTATGLGYTAVEASLCAGPVTTIERDPHTLEIARINPWSRSLFNNPKIHSLIGDSFDCITTFAPGSFSAVVHDPPVITLAGDLYSARFYEAVMSVLSRKGKMFHYIGDPKSKSGARTTAGVIERLKRAGFAVVKPVPEAFGVVAQK